MNYSDLSFRKKIFILLALPVLGFLWQQGKSILNNTNVHTQMVALTQLTQLSVSYSELVHELQKERGITAGFLGSKGEKFADKIDGQRRDTNNKVTQKNNFLSSNRVDNVEISNLNTTINTDIQKLANIRQQVNELSIPLSDAISFYTNLNAKLLSVSAVIADLSTDAEMTKQTTAYYNFLQGKERAGIERAVLSNTFSANQFAPGMFVKFLSLVTQQNTYFDNFSTFAKAENKSTFEQQLNHNSIDEVKHMRKVAQEKPANFGIDAVYWFEQSTARIGQLKKIENALSEKLIHVASIKKEQAFVALLTDILIAIVLVALALIVSVLTIKDLSARVVELTAVMSQVRDSNDLSVSAKLTGASELGLISSALNLTLAKFSRAIDEISTSSLTLASAAEETSQTCQYNSQSLTEQQEGIALVATAVEELSATVKEVATNTQMTADSAKLADNQAQTGLSVVKKSYRSIENLAMEIDGLAERINNLHESSSKITNVVDVIKSVAEQTNLLALNAAIEAARAGEQGRGFAVVADEVRTLAQRTQESTLEIEGFITALQADANSAFNVIEQSQDKASEAVKNSQEVEHSLEDITGSVSNIFSMTEQIATAIEEQSVVTQDVAHNVVSIEQKSMETTTGATQIATTAKEQAVLATTLQDLASTFKT